MFKPKRIIEMIDWRDGVLFILVIIGGVLIITDV